MGRRQVVRQRILTSSFGGSNPPVPVSQISYFCIFFREFFVSIYFIKETRNKNNLKVFLFIFSFLSLMEKKRNIKTKCINEE
jgi:hypothetical protein